MTLPRRNRKGRPLNAQSSPRPRFDDLHLVLDLDTEEPGSEAAPRASARPSLSRQLSGRLRGRYDA